MGSHSNLPEKVAFEGSVQEISFVNTVEWGVFCAEGTASAKALW